MAAMTKAGKPCKLCRMNPSGRCFHHPYDTLLYPTTPVRSPKKSPKSPKKSSKKSPKALLRISPRALWPVDAMMHQGGDEGYDDMYGDTPVYQHKRRSM